MEARKIDGRSVWNDIQLGISDSELMKKYGLSRTQLFMLMERLRQKALLSDGQRCPKCGYIQELPFSDCPKCGIVTSKVGQKTVKKAGILQNLREKVETSWDYIDCRLYQLLRK